MGVELRPRPQISVSEGPPETPCNGFGNWDIQGVELQCVRRSRLARCTSSRRGSVRECSPLDTRHKPITTNLQLDPNSIPLLLSSATHPTFSHLRYLEGGTSSRSPLSVTRHSTPYTNQIPNFFHSDESHLATPPPSISKVHPFQPSSCFSNFCSLEILPVYTFTSALSNRLYIRVDTTIQYQYYYHCYILHSPTAISWFLTGLSALIVLCVPFRSHFLRP